MAENLHGVHQLQHFLPVQSVVVLCGVQLPHGQPVENPLQVPDVLLVPVEEFPVPVLTRAVVHLIDDVTVLLRGHFPGEQRPTEALGFQFHRRADPVVEPAGVALDPGLERLEQRAEASAADNGKPGNRLVPLLVVGSRRTEAQEVDADIGVAGLLGHRHGDAAPNARLAERAPDEGAVLGVVHGYREIEDAHLEGVAHLVHKALRIP